MKPWEVFSILLLVRLLSVFLVQTWYVPDEYWQSLEIAHKFVFGYGHLTWEWKQGIRSYIHPLVISIAYKILHLINLDYAEALIFVPRIMQAFLSAYADYRFYVWSGTRRWAIFTIASSWFWFYTGSRTIINSVEMALTAIALSYFPWPDRKNDPTKFIWIIGFLCVVRPTAGIFWLPLCIDNILKSSDKKLLISNYLLAGSIILVCSILIDSLAHGSILISCYEFLKANIIQGVGSWYSSQPWYWYFSIGIPAVLGIHLVPFTLASYHIIKYKKAYPNEILLLKCMAFTVGIYSLIPHKEFRFILPLLPMALHISAVYLSKWSCKADMLLIWTVSGFITICNLIPAIYLGLIHQRGALDVMPLLRNISTVQPHNTSLLFLLPCHSTPLYSHLHVNVTTHFLTCLPNLNNVDGYVDEADYFYENPSRWLRSHYPPGSSFPSHVVAYDVLIPHLGDLLSRYKPIHRIFHTKINVSERIGNYLTIHERIDISVKYNR